MKRVVPILVILCLLFSPTLVLASGTGTIYLSSLEPPFDKIINSYISGSFVLEQGYHAIVPEEKAFLLISHDDTYRLYILDYHQSGWTIGTISAELPRINGLKPSMNGDISEMFHITYENNIDSTAYEYHVFTFVLLPNNNWRLNDYLYEYSLDDKPGVYEKAAVFIDTYNILFESNLTDDGDYRQETIWGILDSDLRTTDIAALPLTFEDVMSQISTEGLAFVNNPNPDDRLHLRSEASKSSESKGKYYNGTIVTLGDTVGHEWVQVSIEGVNGYMMKEYLVPLTNSQNVIAAQTTYINVDEISEVYERHSKESKTLFLLPPQAGVQLLGITEDGWSHILYRGVGGYVPSDSLTKDMIVEESNG